MKHSEPDTYIGLRHDMGILKTTRLESSFKFSFFFSAKFFNICMDFIQWRPPYNVTKRLIDHHCTDDANNPVTWRSQYQGRHPN